MSGSPVPGANSGGRLPPSGTGVVQPQAGAHPLLAGLSERSNGCIILGKDTCPAQREEGGGLPPFSFRVQRVCVREGGSRELGFSLTLCRWVLAQPSLSPRPRRVPRHGAPDLQRPPQRPGWRGLHGGQDRLHDHQLRGQVRAAPPGREDAGKTILLLAFFADPAGIFFFWGVRFTS